MMQDKIIQYLENNKKISINEFLSKITIPVLLVVSEKNAKQISQQSQVSTYSLLSKTSEKVAQKFFEKIDTDYPGLKSIDIRLLILPLGNYEQLVESFEQNILGGPSSGSI